MVSALRRRRPNDHSFLWRRSRLALAAGIIALVGTVAGPIGAGAGDGPSSCTEAASTNPLTLYGDTLTFEVLRNGSPVGTHTVRFEDASGSIITRTRFDVRVDVLFFTAYRYVYQSSATWRDGCLLTLDAVTDDNGDTSTVRVSRRGSDLVVSGPGGSSLTGLATLPTEHWNAAVVDDRAVINTITGRVNAVEIDPRGLERVETASGTSVMARRFAYTGELTNEVWYDEEGRWVKMRFPGTDGSVIDYVCVTCGRDSGKSQS